MDLPAAFDQQRRSAEALGVGDAALRAHPGSVARHPALALHGNCAECALQHGCLPPDLSASERQSLEATITSRHVLKSGELLYSAGDRLVALYAVRAGLFKTSMPLEDGREQVTGFFLTGDMLGLDGIDKGYHTSQTVALDQSEVCVISWASLQQTARESQPLQHHAHRMLGREIARDHNLMLMLGTMSANERVATFLLSFSQRMRSRGYSASEFLLRMTREEIGSFLGLRLETVSRSLSKLHEQGLIDADRRHIVIRNMDGLARVVHG